MAAEQFRRVVELLTEMRWQQATFTSFIPQASKEYKMFKKKVDEIGQLRELCEKEAMEAAR